jgi:hypothetical protein
MPIYAGFDIGIKNLAYCIIDSTIWKNYQNGKSLDPGILAWRNINLYGDPPTCCGNVKKTNTICGKKATWSLEEKYYCGTHKPKDENICPYKQPLIKNLNIADFKKQAFIELDSEPLFDNVKYIVIESQPRKNQMMKMFATSIETFFLIRHQLDKNDPILQSIKNSPAKNKLSLYKGPFINTSHIKNAYDKRKWLAEQHTKYFLSNSPNVLEQFFEKFDKKDDLADAFLHCILAITKRAR